MRVLHASVCTGVVLLGAATCRPAPKPAAEMKAVPRVAMDSAEIDRLCAEPDSVRQGLSDCVLKDQSAPLPGPLRPTPPPPPPPR